MKLLIKECLQAVKNLNDELFDKYKAIMFKPNIFNENVNYLFEFKTDGEFCDIYFADHLLWSSTDDDRAYTDDLDYEPVEKHIREKFNELINSFQQIKL